jgi:hypothetical protein
MNSTTLWIAALPLALFAAALTLRTTQKPEVTRTSWRHLPSPRPVPQAVPRAVPRAAPRAAPAVRPAGRRIDAPRPRSRERTPAHARALYSIDASRPAASSPSK